MLEQTVRARDERFESFTMEYILKLYGRCQCISEQTGRSARGLGSSPNAIGFYPLE